LLASLAATTGLSKRERLYSVVSYVREFKLSEAANRLTKNSDRVIDIAMALARKSVSVAL
jgi:hypothetical protein